MTYKTNKAAKMDHPGTFIREELDCRGWTQRDLAFILGRHEQSINAIISGKRGISADMAKALAKAFDVPAEFFMNLQRIYDLESVGEPDPSIEKRARFYQGSYPIREMARRGWIKETDDASLLEAQMMRFFEVDKLDNIPHLAHAAKKLGYENTTSTQLVWLYRVRQLAKEIACPAYSEKRLRSSIDDLHRLLAEPEEVRHVPRILTECGIRYVLVEALPGSKIDGVCFWLDNKSPVIGMSIRFDRIDNFWFVLRHEIEHVLRKDGRQQPIIDVELDQVVDGEGAMLPQEEIAANIAGSDFCLAKTKLDAFIARKYPYISERDVLGFARTLEIHPGIAVGQIQHRLKDYRLFRKYLANIRSFLLPSALVDGWGEMPPISL